jgi:hypothetical protein
MVREALQEMARVDGLDGCALADAETGMVWHAAGEAGDMEGLSEASVDFWRLRSRLAGALDALGHLQALVLVHSRRRLTIVACGPALLLVAVSGRDARVDWETWKRNVARLQKLAASL